MWIYAVLSIIALVFALLVVFASEPIVSALSLLVVFFCIAGIYALLGAHLIAGLQILVYAGAVLVLFVFVMMLLNPQKEHKQDIKKNFVYILPLSVLLGIFMAVFITCPEPVFLKPFSLSAVEALGGNTQLLSLTLFKEYLFPFELASFLLLSAMIATVCLAKRKQG